MSATFTPSRAHLALGERFSTEVEPARFPKRIERFRNERWAERVGLGHLDASEWERHFARFDPLEGSFERPLALAYHGHQFGVYNPRLGDGRGFLFAQLVEPETGRLLDLGTKGSGQTPWSRGGDGRLTLRGGVREVLATEMLEALGVPTSKSWSLYETGEKLHRGDEPSPSRSSVLVRLVHSHIRIGTFQRLAFEDDRASISKLVDHVIEHHYPALANATDRPLAFFRALALRAADLVAAYQVAGFVHGVLNTDNMNVTGESFDYGPYRFLGRLDDRFVAAYFDHTGLYAFGEQPRTFRWNLGRLADALRPLSPTAPFGGALDAFDAAFAEAHVRRFVARLGLRSQGHDLDTMLTHRARTFLEKSEVTLDRFFFDWRSGAASARRALEGPAKARYAGPAFDAFREVLDAFEPTCASVLSTPYFARSEPIGLRYELFEELWRSIERMDDWTPFDSLVADIRELGAACTSLGGSELAAPLAP